MMPKYSNLRTARTELEGFLNGLGAHHPGRSLIEKSLYDIEKVIAIDPTIRACTPEPGYVENRLKETGNIMTFELICSGCGKEILGCTKYIELYNGILFHNDECEQKYYDEVEQINILICDGCGEQIFDCAHHIQYENDLVFHNSDCEDSYNRC